MWPFFNRYIIEALSNEEFVYYIFTLIYNQFTLCVLKYLNIKLEIKIKLIIYTYFTYFAYFIYILFTFYTHIIYILFIVNIFIYKNFKNLLFIYFEINERDPNITKD